MIRRALYFLIAVLMCSCVHEFPNTNTPADVVLNIHMDISMEGQSYVNIAKEDEPATVQETRESVQSQLNADEYDVQAFYYGDKNYNESNASSSFKIDKNIVPIDVTQDLKD